jgi:DNA-directed RNA polymerase specialized sigma24 family protein
MQRKTPMPAPNPGRGPGGSTGLLDREPPEQRAERTVSENYEKLKPTVSRIISSRLRDYKIHVDWVDLEETYNQAWMAIFTKIAREVPIFTVPGLLVEITWRRTLDMYRTSHPGRWLEIQMNMASVDSDVDDQLDDKSKIERLLSQLRIRLSERQLIAFSLCYIKGYKRSEVASVLDITRPQIERLMDGTTRKLADVAAGISARGCGGDEWQRLLRAYAWSHLREDSRDYSRVVDHLVECDSCRRYTEGLKRSSHDPDGQ